MEPLFRKGLLAGLGMLTLTREKVEQVLDDLVKKGEISKDESTRVIREWADKIDARTRESRLWIRSQIEEIWDQVRPGSEAKLEQISARLDKLEARLKKIETQLKKSTAGRKEQ